MSMDQQLAAHFGNGITKQASAEELQKQATVELFHKMASNAKVDLDTLSVAEIENLWTGTIGKLAAEGKLDEAIKKHAEFPAGQEGRRRGRQEEEGRRGEEGRRRGGSSPEARDGGEDGRGRDVRSHDGPRLRRRAPRDRQGSGPEDRRRDARGVQEAPRGQEGRRRQARREEGQGEGRGEEGPPSRRSHRRCRTSTSSRTAMRSISPSRRPQRGGGGPEVAAVRILGLAKPENTKIASAQNTDHAIHIRALELLETAGYTVNWNKA
jgi:hypothetical protein